MGGLMAAGLTALMILLFLGNWRLTLIILATIPLAIIAAILVIFVDGQTLNTMTLGGFAWPSASWSTTARSSSKISNATSMKATH
jgi:multidrug efflux pump subunit AcrB